MALVCLFFGFRSLCVSLVRDAALLSTHKVREIEMALSKVSVMEVLKEKWQAFPGLLSRMLHTAGRTL